MTEKTILIIDDEEILHESIKDVLEDEPYKIISAYNGEEGLEYAIKFHPDLIFLDLRMPIMTGFQFLEELKKTGGAVRLQSLSSLGTGQSKTRAWLTG